MANPFYRALNGGSPAITDNPINSPNFGKILQQFKSNPLGYILQARYNVPANISNDANAMLEYLVSSGQINPKKVEWAKQLMAQNSK